MENIENAAYWTLAGWMSDISELKSKRSSCRPSLHRTITLKRGIEEEEEEKFFFLFSLHRIKKSIFTRFKATLWRKTGAWSSKGGSQTLPTPTMEPTWLSSMKIKPPQFSLWLTTTRWIFFCLLSIHFIFFFLFKKNYFLFFPLKVKNEFYGHHAKPVSLAWSPDNEHFATGGMDMMVYVWAVDDADKRIKLPGISYKCFSLRYMFCPRTHLDDNAFDKVPKLNTFLTWNSTHKGPQKYEWMTKI